MILCADDYGMSESVSRGIIELIDGGRLTATSCMVTGSRGLDRQMTLLAERREAADIGLHLTLTNDRPLTEMGPRQGLVDGRGQFLSFNALMFNCYRGRVDRERLGHEIRAQLVRFEELAGFPPAFVDGHQHVHQLPIVRDVLLQTCADGLRGDYYVRCGTFPAKWLLRPSLPSRMKLESALIGLPAIGLKRMLERRSVMHNTHLLGHYKRRYGLAFDDIVNRYLSLQPGSNDIFYVHPGHIDEELKAKDPFVEERVLELEFLRGDRFLKTLESAGIALNRFSYGSPTEAGQ